jgi:hypothetical protein
MGAIQNPKQKMPEAWGTLVTDIGLKEGAEREVSRKLPGLRLVAPRLVEWDGNGEQKCVSEERCTFRAKR